MDKATLSSEARAEAAIAEATAAIRAITARRRIQGTSLCRVERAEIPPAPAKSQAQARIPEFVGGLDIFRIVIEKERCQPSALFRCLEANFFKVKICDLLLAVTF
jgi:hypothetical protein